MSRYSSYYPHHSPFARPSRRKNGLGVAGFTVSLLALFTCGLLSPLGLLMSGLAMFKRPRGFAVAGMILGMIGTLFVSSVIWMTGASVQTVRREVEQSKHQKQTMSAIVQATQAIETHRVENGELPEGVQGNKLVLPFEDSWGRSLRYDREGDRYEILSSGADGKFLTPDDLVSPASAKTGKPAPRLLDENSPGAKLPSANSHEEAEELIRLE